MISNLKDKIANQQHSKVNIPSTWIGPEIGIPFEEEHHVAPKVSFSKSMNFEKLILESFSKTKS